MDILDRNAPPRLEGLCGSATTAGPAPARLLYGQGGPGIERLAADFTGPAFAPHRHDTYAIGVTLRGVQTFRYRGEQRYCLVGEGHVLHPDELHDGAGGTEEGFGYRILYIDPALVQEALGGRALPFVANPVIDRKWMRPVFEQGLLDIDQPLDPCQQVDLTLSVAHLLQRHAGTSTRLRTPLALDRLVRVRELIAADPSVPRPLGELERVAGLDRWTLARQFRAAFGTSPSHFRTMRQLDRARTLVRAGATLADAAAEAGFADQSHFTRLFKRAYGLTPASWRRAMGQ